jgi:2-polyprenyl-3-methyl-5-hydroxy-6-metoxy-1,4-benzoquinol methylase
MVGRKYSYKSHEPPPTIEYILPRVQAALAGRRWQKNARALDYGCGNGWLTGWLAQNGFAAVGVDISESGIEVATRANGSAIFSSDVSVENLQTLGPFDLAVCIETIAHCHDSAVEIAKVFEALKPGGLLVLSTPYHGYLKNLALAVAGRLDTHLTALWSGGYVRFFSRPTIRRLLEDAGFGVLRIERVGRFAPLAKAMLVSAIKPEDAAFKSKLA